MGEERLIIFYRNPILGNVKTRLAASIGDRAALDVYVLLCLHTQMVAGEIPQRKIVYYDEAVWSGDLWDEIGAFKNLQQGYLLGDRMCHAFDREFKEGAGSLLVIGTDCPDLRANHLLAAFQGLTQHDLVIGPASDGGYYLLGMNKLYPELFSNINWGGTTVYQETYIVANALGLSVHLLPKLNDVDREEDLIHLRNLSGKTD